MINRLIITLCILLFQKGVCHSQNGASCQDAFSGKVICIKTQELLSFATIYIKDIRRQGTANDTGLFSFSGICPGPHEIEIAQYGHRTLDTVLSIEPGRFYMFNLEADETHTLKEVVIQEQQIKKQEVQSLQRDELSGLALEKTRGLSLGESLKSITGVTTLQTGPTISKPMIHGLYGNRILLLNNGVRLEGQNWGADHAPEIDPFIATRLSVIKGAASIRYGMNALAGVVLVEPKEMPRAKSMNGELNLVGATNGRSGTISGFLQGAFDKKLSGLSWRLQGTSRQAGSFSTPTYYLTNSGVKEKNYSGTLSYIKSNFGSSLFFSDFNSTLGIYSGTAVGNLADLEAAFQRTTPLVPSIFSYKIGRGYQAVGHKTAKANLFYKFPKIGTLEYTYAWQQNTRSEYGDEQPYNPLNPNAPKAYFQLTTNTQELILEHKAIKTISGSIGANFITQGNIYQGDDYRALIPNYRNYGGGLFILEKWSHRKLILEGGARYDYLWMQTYTEDFSTLTKHSSEYNWNNYSGNLGAAYKFDEHFSFNTSLGIGWRPPAPIELFAHGIHQSAASYELGDTSLKAERSYNSQIYFNYACKKLAFEIGGYYNYITNYIYLKPLYPQTITNAAGTYPLFQYTAANVYFTGIDASVHYSLFKWLSLTSKTTYVYAYNRSIHDYLIYVPANRFDNGISLTKDAFRKLKQLYLSVSILVVGTQHHVPPNSDYVPPPKGYQLLNADIGFSIPIHRQQISLSFSATNIMNTVYRDYLDRFRYYNNALGRNFTLRLKMPFSVFGSAKE